MLNNHSGSLLSIQNLCVGFESDGRVTEILDSVSFDIKQGEIYGLVGESGCGKSVTALSILELLPRPASRMLEGKILFKGRELPKRDEVYIRTLRGQEISMVFQEPMSALNPLLTIRRQLEECFEYHNWEGSPETRIRELMKKVGFTDVDRVMASYPHQLSGGMLQRVVIAMALMLKPSLIIADEPTTALDVTIQAQIMDLLIHLQKETGTSILLITHNLNLIAQYADRLAVMYAGRIVEESRVEAFLEKPLHPYSQGLLKALPDLSEEKSLPTAIPGQVPQPKDFVSGCRFRNRCERAMDICSERPALKSMNEFRKVACFLYNEELV